MVTTNLEQSIQDKHTTEVNSQANELGSFLVGFSFFLFFFGTSVLLSSALQSPNP